MREACLHGCALMWMAMGMWYWLWLYWNFCCDDCFAISFGAAGVCLDQVRNILVSHLGCHAFGPERFDVVQEDFCAVFGESQKLACDN